jgi:branched-chain amino acid transport system substrate-binding protein
VRGGRYSLRRPRVLVAAGTTLVLSLTFGLSSLGVSTAAAATTYTIGFEALNSGPAAFAGIPLGDGVNLAIDQANKTGYLGKGTHIHLIEQDGGGDEAKSISIVQGFLSDHVSGVICCSLAEAESIQKITAQAHVPAVVDSAIDAGLNKPPYMYRPVLLLSTTAYPEEVRGAKQAYGVKTAIVATASDVSAMESDAHIWDKALAASGIKSLGTVFGPSTQTDFTGLATQIIAKKPDMLVGSMLGGPETLLVKQLREDGWKGVVVTQYGISDQANYKLGGTALAGVIFDTPFSPLQTSSAAVSFTKLYQAAFHQAPSLYSAQGYAAAEMLLEGIKNAQSGNPQKVAQAMAKITHMDLPYGPVSFRDGQAYLTGPPLLLQWNANGTQKIFKP